MVSSDISTSTTLPDFDRLWNYRKPDETESAFRKLLPIAEASSDRSYHLQLLTQIARCQALQRQFDEAHRTLDEVERRLDDDAPLPLIRYLLERGRVFNSSGSPEQAKLCFVEAWEKARTAGADFFAVDAAHMVAIVETPDEALRWNETAFELAEASTDQRAKEWVGALTNNIGWTYHDKGEYERALEYFRRNVEWHTVKKTTRQLLIAKWSVARVLRSLGRLDEALAAQYDLLVEEKAMELDQDGYILEELGECLIALGRKEEAREYFIKAYELLSTDIWLAANEPARLERMKTLGAV